MTTATAEQLASLGSISEPVKRRLAEQAARAEAERRLGTRLECLKLATSAFEPAPIDVVLETARRLHNFVVGDDPEVEHTEQPADKAA